VSFEEGELRNFTIPDSPELEVGVLLFAITTTKKDYD
jgi:hypothetical protein